MNAREVLAGLALHLTAACPEAQGILGILDKADDLEVTLVPNGIWVEDKAGSNVRMAQVGESMRVFAFGPMDQRYSSVVVDQAAARRFFGDVAAVLLAKKECD